MYLESKFYKKSKVMKITEETKIKELIPEGWKLDSTIRTTDSIRDEGESIQCIKIVTIPIKKKQEKDFEWYVNEYYKKNICLGRLNQEKDTIPSKDWMDWKFEYRIGLFKFICDDLNLSGYGYWKLLDSMCFGTPVKKIMSICPIAFIHSLLK